MIEDPRLRRPPMVLAAALFLLGLLVLLWPVSTSLPQDGQSSAGDGSYSRTCGIVVTEAFATAGPRLDGLDRDSELDCAARARGRVGFGVLLVLLALPPALVAGLTPGGLPADRPASAGPAAGPAV